jgi:pimeloyl-ACP methyl ester carboxylesterase
MKKLFFISLIFSVLASCQKENINFAADADETFYAQNEGHSMKVQVKGNTASKIILLVVHGGPGQGTYEYRENTPEFKNILEKKYAVAYWEQRVTDMSQSRKEGNMTLKTYGDDMKIVVLSLKKRYGADAKIFIMGHSWGGMVTTQFMTDGNNQNLVQGWVFVDAVFDWNQSDKDVVAYINQTADEQIKLGKNAAKWDSIKIKANAFDLSAAYTNDRYVVFQQNALDAMKIFYEEENGKLELPSFGKYPVLNILKSYLTDNTFGLLFTSNTLASTEKLIVDARKQSLGSKIPSITKPVLAVIGKRDFIVSPVHAKRFYDLLPAGKKEFLELPNSYHFFEDTGLFVNNMVKFIEKYK